MFICKRNSNFTYFVLQLNLIVSNKLHNLKRLSEPSRLFEIGMRVRFIPTRITQTSSEYFRISDDNTVRSKSGFPNTDYEAMDYSGRNFGINDCPGSSGMSKAATGGSNTNKESIASKSKAKPGDTNNKQVKANVSKTHYPKSQNYFHSSITQINQSQLNVQMQQALYLSNGLAQSLNITNYQTCPNVFCHSLSDSASNKNLNSVCFNSRQPEPKVSSRLSRATSTTRQSNVERFWKQTTLGKILDKKKSGGKLPGRKFKIMSYNVLAQDLLVEHPELYRQNEPHTLSWEHRWRLLFQEIKEHDCDILCLQEVQFEHIENYYNVLKLLGYKGIYKQRTGIRTDGCAIYYKKNLFHLLEHIDVEYNQPNVTLLDRDNVAIVAKFAPKENLLAEFVVATTHLLYNPKRLDVRLAQVQVLLTEVERIAHKKQHNGMSGYIPVIITGDLNSTPDTPLYQFIRNGRLKYENLELRKNHGLFGKVLLPPSLRITDFCQHADLLQYKQSKAMNISRREELKLIKLRNSRQSEVRLEEGGLSFGTYFGTGTLSHPFKLTSVYNHTVNGSTEGTTYQHEWITVDYIFYSGFLDEANKFRDDKLKLLSYYSLPTSQELQNVRIPNFELGSDHLALLAKFKLEY